MASHIFHITSVALHDEKSLNSTWLPIDKIAVGTYHFMYKWEERECIQEDRLYIIVDDHEETTTINTMLGD